ncbi:MAG: hypothetical protein PHV79_01685, partial [Clostridia bacterium]|nr:hypothetical protein [Clostridia bacterium]
ANVYAGQSNTININVRGIGNVQYDFKDANGTPYAGGIIAYATGVAILECHNRATVFSGFYDSRLGADDSPWNQYGGIGGMSTWWDGRSETITKNGTNESYAGGIVGYASNTTVNDSNNYASIEANAKQDLTIECVWYRDYGIIYGEHKLFAGFAKERSYASGIANIDTSSFLQNCQNNSQVSGGYEVGFNYVFNTPYGIDPFSQEKFYLLHYGISYYHRQKFNNLCYLYSWNVDIRDEIIATGEIYGMTISGSNDNYTFTNTNVFYGNQVCNNPSNVFTTVTLGGLDYKYYYTSDEYGYAGGCSYTGTSSTVCTYSSSFGGTTKSRATLPSLFYPDNEPENIVEPIVGDEERITWQEIRPNDWMLGVYQYTN